MFSNFLDFPNFYIKLSNFAVVLFSYFVFSINENTDTYLPRNLPLSWNGFRKILVSFLADTTWKVDDINRTIFFAYYCVYFFLRTAVNFTFCIHKHDWLDCRALRNREAVFTWKRGCKKNIIVSMGYRLHLPNMTSPERLWNQPGDYSQSQRRNIRVSMIEYTVFLWLAYM